MKAAGRKDFFDTLRRDHIGRAGWTVGKVKNCGYYREGRIKELSEGLPSSQQPRDVLHGQMGLQGQVYAVGHHAA